MKTAILRMNIAETKVLAHLGALGVVADARQQLRIVADDDHAALKLRGKNLKPQPTVSIH